VEAAAIFSTFWANLESPQRSKTRRRAAATERLHCEYGRLHNCAEGVGEWLPDWSALAADSGLSASGSLDDFRCRQRRVELAGFSGPAAFFAVRALRDFRRRQPSSRAEDDLSQQRMIARALLIDDGGESTLAIRSAACDPPWGFVTPEDARAREGSRMIPSMRQSGS